MTDHQRGRDNDPAIVRREYQSEDRFLARRLTRWARLRGPLVEDAAIAAVAETDPHRVLDVGCGTGDFTERLRDSVAADVMAMDLSTRMIELTRSRGLDSARGDVQRLPFASQVFDCVLANRLLYHVPELDLGLAEIARVLRPGGRLVAVTYATDHLGELWSIVGESPMGSTFAAENGAAALGRHFAIAERGDLTGTATFPSVDAIRRYLAAYGEFAPIDLSAKVGAIEAPFEATYRHAIFIGSPNREG